MAGMIAAATPPISHSILQVSGTSVLKRTSRPTLSGKEKCPALDYLCAACLQLTLQHPALLPDFAVLMAFYDYRSILRCHLLLHRTCCHVHTHRKLYFSLDGMDRSRLPGYHHLSHYVCGNCHYTTLNKYELTSMTVPSMSRAATSSTPTAKPHALVLRPSLSCGPRLPSGCSLASLTALVALFRGDGNADTAVVSSAVAVSLLPHDNPARRPTRRLLHKLVIADL